jgi:DSBA-like thioredoxin domain
MARAIDFYFDFASPYGFIASTRIDAVAENIGRTVNWRPFLLGAVYKAFGQSPLEHPLKRDYVMKVDAPRIARQTGLQLKVPADFPEHSLPPARAFYWIEARAPAKAAQFAERSTACTGWTVDQPAMWRLRWTRRPRSDSTPMRLQQGWKHQLSRRASYKKVVPRLAEVCSAHRLCSSTVSPFGEATGST